MSTHFKPQNEQDISEALAWALNNQSAFEVISGATKRAFGRPMAADAILDLSELSGIVLYEPEELVLTAAAGTSLSEINAALAAQGQELAFEPLDYGPLYGLEAGGATIAGILAGNIAGSRRIKAGAARDHFLGVTAVSGRGEVFKSGGRVVKNVTGYDLCKGLAGSWGTLAVMTEVTVKVLPAGEKIRTVIVSDLENAEAVKTMSAAMASACEVSGAAHLPDAVCRGREIPGLKGINKTATALRVEGFGPSVDYRAEQLVALLKEFGTADILQTASSKSLWNEISNCRVFTNQITRPLWRISVPPKSGARVVRRISEQTEVTCFFDWAGGLIWLECPDENNACETIIRSAFADCGGHATLVRAGEDLRKSVPVFHPQSNALAGLSGRLKNGFDPHAILNPGRMVEGV